MGIYNLSNSFLNPDIDATENILFLERFEYFNSILFFVGLGFVYYILTKHRRTRYRGNSTKVNTALLFGCLIFVLNSLFLIFHPERFKGTKILKLIIAYTGLIFFGLGFIVSILLLFGKKKKH